MEAWNKYKQANDRMVSLAAQGNTEQARNLLEGECAEFYNALHTSLGNIIAYNTTGSEKATQESVSLYRIALLAQGAVMAVSIIIGVSEKFEKPLAIPVWLCYNNKVRYGKLKEWGVHPAPF